MQWALGGHCALDGQPTWATVHSIVQGLGAPAGTTTIVEPGSPAKILAKHAVDADAIVLGPSHRRFGIGDLQRTLERRTKTSVLRIDEVLPDDHRLLIDAHTSDLLSTF